MTAPQQHYTISRARLIELLKELPCQFEPTVMKALTQTTVAAPTPAPQQPQPHCEHECVCQFLSGARARQQNTPCRAKIEEPEGFIPCPHDTRGHSAASEQRIEQVIKELEEKWEHPDWPVEIKYPMTAYRLALEQAIALLRGERHG